MHFFFKLFKNNIHSNKVTYFSMMKKWQIKKVPICQGLKNAKLNRRQIKTVYSRAGIYLWFSILCVFFCFFLLNILHILNIGSKIGCKKYKVMEVFCLTLRHWTLTTYKYSQLDNIK